MLFPRWRSSSAALALPRCDDKSKSRTTEPQGNVWAAPAEFRFDYSNFSFKYEPYINPRCCRDALCLLRLRLLRGATTILHLVTNQSTPKVSVRCQLNPATCNNEFHGLTPKHANRNLMEHLRDVHDFKGDSVQCLRLRERLTLRQKISKLTRRF